MNALSFIVLAATVSLLAIWAGGIVPAALGIAAVAGCGLAAAREARRPAADPAAPFPWVEVAALAALGFLALTALPLPPALEAWTGAARQAQNDTVRQALRDAVAAGLSADTSPWFALTRNRA